MWATDAFYFRVMGWGYFYLVTVMDDYSRFILAHKLQHDMACDSFIEVDQDRHGSSCSHRPHQALE
jgi:transposase InsO family protein